MTTQSTEVWYLSQLNRPQVVALSVFTQPREAGIFEGELGKGNSMFNWLKNMFGRKNSRDESEGRRNRERAEVRLPFGLAVGEHKLVGTTLDVSMKGALLQVEEGTFLSPELADSQGIIRLMLPDGEFRVDCLLTRVEWSGIAIAFKGLKADEKQKIFEYLETQLGDVW